MVRVLDDGGEMRARLLCLLPLGIVLQDAGVAGDFAALVPHGRKIDRYGDPPPVLVKANRIEDRYVPAGPQLRPQDHELRPMLRRDGDFDRSAEDISRLMAEESFGAGVPAEYGAVECGRYDGNER
jgi:hypothetical protein